MENLENENTEQNSVNEDVKKEEMSSEVENQETPNSEDTDKTAVESNEVEELQKNVRHCTTITFVSMQISTTSKRTLKEKADLIKSAGENIFNNMLPLVDDFERAKSAMENSTDGEAIKEGVELIYNKFISFLSQNGVKAIETEAKDFDTDFHEAIAKIPAPTEDLKGKVVDCTQKGYTLNDKVIRYAKVVVGE